MSHHPHESENALPEQVRRQDGVREPGGIPVTVLVQTKNEAVGIEHCLAALGDFDEVVVVDSDSTDDTVALARAAGARVENFTWNGAYPKKKQWQLTNLVTRHPWVLFMDADETPTPELIADLRARFAPEPADTVAAFDIGLDYAFDGRTLRHGHRVVKRALVHRDRVEFPAVDDLSAPGMGELEGHYQPVPRGSVERPAGRILHDDQDPVRTWFDRHNRYSDWEVHLRANPQARADIARLRSGQGRVFDHVPGKPLAFFAYAYLARGGFLDGVAGFNYALALSFYYWQIGLKVREDRRRRAERPAPARTPVH